MFTEYLRSIGYYCTNNAKEDYNFRTLPSAWNESGREATWKNRPTGAPFFAVFNFGITHESQVWAQGDKKLLVAPEEVPVPPIFPDNDTIRKDLAVNYSNIIRMDQQIGAIIEQLKEEGLYEDTYIFFYGDHGGPFPRYKRALYETGLKVPFIVKLPGNAEAATRSDRLISFIDLAPTLL
jgi:membrane-anchored protein YejM (alkaline phosphatase superfamily)